MRWSLTTRVADTTERLLRDNPVLLLAGPRSPGPIEALVRMWDPGAIRDGDLVVQIADGVRWHGPFRLEPGLAAETGLPGGWSTAYVAEGRRGEAVRGKQGKDRRTGAQAVAWNLVSGLARLLDGAARLPGCEPCAPEPEDTVYCVYGHEALPWQVLQAVVGLAIPDLARNGVSAANDYCLDRPGLLEIRVRPFSAAEFRPCALRSGTEEDWLRTVYRFSALKQSTAAETGRVVERLRKGAVLLADVIGGVALDGEGFPVAEPTMP